MILRMKARVRDKTRRVKRAAKRGSIQSLQHAGAAVRLTARRSIRRSKKPSRPGKPPHTKRGALKKAILYAMNRNRTSVVIGPDAGMVNQIGRVHEIGGKFKGEYYPPRPFMGPALASIRPRLPRFWAASVR